MQREMSLTMLIVAILTGLSIIFIWNFVVFRNKARSKIATSSPDFMLTFFKEKYPDISSSDLEDVVSFLSKKFDFPVKDIDPKMLVKDFVGEDFLLSDKILSVEYLLHKRGETEALKNFDFESLVLFLIKEKRNLSKLF